MEMGISIPILEITMGDGDGGDDVINSGDGDSIETLEITKMVMVMVEMML